MSERPTPIEIQKSLSGIDYPAEKEELLSAARDAGAGDEVIAALEGLPERSYDSPTAVSGELGNGEPGSEGE